MAMTDSLAGRQHQLALDEKPDRSLPPTYATYDWVSEGLAERSGENAVIYAYWGQPFGCKVRRQNREPEDFLPDWPFLDAPDYGRTADLKSVLSHHPKTLGTGIAAGPGAEKAFEEYVANLPKGLIQLVAPFGAQQWLLLDLVRRAPGLWRKLHQQTALGRLGTLSLSLELFFAAGRTRPQQRQLFAEALNEATRETVLSRYLGRAPDPSLLALLEQVPPGSGILKHRALTSALNRTSATIDLKDIARMKDDMTEKALNQAEWSQMLQVKPLLEKGLSFARILHIVRSGLKNLTEAERAGALKALKAVASPQKLQWWLTHWTTLAVRSRAVPPPPIPATPLLSPLLTISSIENENRRMHNGIVRFLPDVLAGDLYFYHWDGRPAATLCLAVSGNGDWSLLEALGEDGVPIHEEALAEILSAVQAG